MPVPGIPVCRYVPLGPKVTFAPLGPIEVLTPLLLKLICTPGAILILFLKDQAIVQLVLKSSWYSRELEDDNLDVSISKLQS